MLGNLLKRKQITAKNVTSWEAFEPSLERLLSARSIEPGMRKIITARIRIIYNRFSSGNLHISVDIGPKRKYEDDLTRSIRRFIDKTQGFIYEIVNAAYLEMLDIIIESETLKASPERLKGATRVDHDKP